MWLRRLEGAQTMKLFLTEQRQAALMMSKDGNQSICFDVPLVTPLQTLESNTGELIASALWESYGKPWDAAVNSTFPAQLDIVTTDDYRGNHKAERIMTERTQVEWPDSEIGKLHLTCDVRKIHACSRAVVDQYPLFSSGLVKSALALRSGQMLKFRHVLSTTLRKRLRIYRGECPHIGGPDQQMHKQLMVSMFFETCLVDEQHGILELLNGDWTMENEIQHYCNGCCNSRDETLHRVEQMLLTTLTKSGPRVFNKAKWIGGHDAWLACSLHGPESNGYPRKLCASYYY